MSRDADLAAIEAGNAARQMDNDFHLRWDSLPQTFVLAYDEKNDAVFLGGLGCMGVGRMWSMRQDSHERLPGWDGAPAGECDPLSAEVFAEFRRREAS